MSFEYKRLCEIFRISSSGSNLVVNPAGTKTYIRLIVLHNTSDSAKATYLYNVPDDAGGAGSPGGANQFYCESIPAYTMRIIGFPVPGLVLEDENDILYAECANSNSVSVQVFGGQE